MTDTETKAQELSRLVTEFDYGERQNRNEAWNLIAEFAYDNAEEICEALSASPKGDDLEPVAWMHPTLSWVHMRRDQVAPHCRKDGPQPVPLVPASRLQSLKAERDAETKRADSNFANIATIQRHLDEATIRAEAAEAENATLKREIAELREAARHIMPYLTFTIGDESPGYHPTMPSAVDAFKEAFATQGGK